MRHFGALDKDGLAVPVYFGIGQVEHTVLAGQFEALDFPVLDRLEV